MDNSRRRRTGDPEALGLSAELRELLPERLIGQLLLLGPAALLLAIQTFGVANADRDGNPVLHLGLVSKYAVWAGTILSLFSPMTSALALLAVLNRRPQPALIFLAVICVALLATSVLGCGWTVLVHPTWTGGYSEFR